MFIAALWSRKWKWLTSGLLLAMLIVILLLSYFFPSKGVILDCIDSCSLLSFLI